jgi:hypothetical protein
LTGAGVVFVQDAVAVAVGPGAAAILSGTGLTGAGVVFVQDAVTVAVCFSDLGDGSRLVTGGAIETHIVSEN